MFLSTFDVFKIGIGPSSSHTVGPMVAAGAFIDLLANWADRIPGSETLASLKVSLHGSLAFTGKGHATDRAVILGLAGMTPETFDPQQAAEIEAAVRTTGRISPPGLGELAFLPERDLVFDFGDPLPGHANGMIFRAFDTSGNPFQTRTFYSVGGGFVKTDRELAREAEQTEPDLHDEKSSMGYPFPFGSAAEMLSMGRASGKSIAAMKRANEQAHSGPGLDARLDALWEAMNATIERGLDAEGILPGGLNIRRRARALHQELKAESGRNLSQPHVVNDWLSVYALAVNEENAAGGAVVTAPTNGAAGIVPAVIRYYRDHCVGGHQGGIREFLLVAAAIGGLIKHNASISGAEVGCQGEVGSAAAMAAAGLCAALGGSNEQVENAAEIALEHHLGMTCDPVKGLVQVPCIERNAMGAIKAVSAASLALRGDGVHLMPLDNCIETMRQTGLDMNARYKETATGGLAVNLPEC